MSEKKKSFLDSVLSDSIDKFLPWEDVKLPSEGLYYDGKIPDGIVQVRPFGLQAEKIMATQRLVKSGKSMDHIFEHYVKLPNDYNQQDLLASDRSFLLYYLRGITYGNDYEFSITCSNEDCKMVSPHIQDLSQLYTNMKKPNREIGPEPFKVILPYFSSLFSKETGDKIDFWVKLRFLRGRDLYQLFQKSKNDKYSNLSDTIEQNLALFIVEIMDDVESNTGCSDHFKINKFIQKLHSVDSSTIRDFIKENTPLLDTVVRVECPHCNNEMKIELPINENFFRPAKSRGDRK